MTEGPALLMGWCRWLSSVCLSYACAGGKGEAMRRLAGHVDGGFPMGGIRDEAV